MPSATVPRVAVRPSTPAFLVVGAVLLATAAALGGLAAARHLGLGRAPEPPRLGAVPDFRLVERSGRAFSRADVAGRPWVADFIFTQCGGACPAMTARMARLQRELPPSVALVSFTVDPAHDTPEVLSRYADAFHAGPGWLFATGPQPALYGLSVGGFKLEAMEVPPAERAAGGDGPFLHSSKFILVDAESAIRGYYDSTDEESLRALVRDAGALPSAR